MTAFLYAIFIGTIIWAIYCRRKSRNGSPASIFDRVITCFDILELCVLSAIMVIDIRYGMGYGFYVNEDIYYPAILKILYVSSVLYAIRMCLSLKFIHNPNTAVFCVICVPLLSMLIVALTFEISFPEYSWSEIQTPDGANTYMLFNYNNDIKDGQGWGGIIYKKQGAFLSERAEYSGRFVIGTLDETYISWQKDGFVFTYQPADTIYSSSVEKASVFVPY